MASAVLAGRSRGGGWRHRHYFHCQIGFREPDFAEHPQEANLRAIGSELQKARAIAKGGIVGFNIMVATKNYAEYVKTAVKAGAD